MVLRGLTLTAFAVWTVHRLARALHDGVAAAFRFGD